MALKPTLTTLDGVPADIAKEYTLQANGTYLLDVDGGFEPTAAVAGLKSALAAEKAQRLQATQKVTELTAEKDSLTTEVVTLRKNTPADIEAAWQLKVKEKEDAGIAREKALLKAARKTLVETTALQLATEVSNAPHLLVGHIQEHLSVVEQDGSFKIVVLGEDKKPTADTVKEFSAKVVADPRFAPIIIASKGSGSGASGKQGSGGTKTFKELTEAERVALFNKDPVAYRALREV